MNLGNISIVLLCVIFYFQETIQAKAQKCRQTNKKPYRYCLDQQCTSDSDCGKNKKCLCDGDCGLTCVPNALNCGKPETPKGIRVRYSNGTRFNSIATFRCQGKQYTLRGSRKRVCRGIGKWNGRPAKCRILCRNPGDIAYGNNNGDKKFYREGTTVRYWCFPGYNIEGDNILTCNNKAKWDKSPPKCALPSCSKPKLPLNAYIKTRQKLKQKYRFNEIIALRCEVGYHSTGSIYQRCLIKGWSNPNLRCIPKSCGDPGTPTNGKRQGYVFTFKNKVFFKCNRGFMRVGPEYRQCQSNQRWSAKTPTCEPVDCGRLPVPQYGEKIEETTTTYGGKVVFQCKKEGYELKGSKQRFCQENGKWDGTITTCEPVECKNPGKPVNGGRIPDKDKYVFEDRIDFQCKANYTIRGDSFIICRKTKDWTGSVPQCLAPCSDPGIPVGGRRLQHSFLHSKVVHFQCNRGWSMEGTHTIRCTNGQWDYTAPTCSDGCDRPRSPVNGGIYRNTWKRRYNHRDRVRFYCYGDYKLDGNQYTSCRNGDWSSDPPTCKRICGTPRLPDGGFSGSEYFEGKEIRYYCHRDFDLIGSQTARCLSTGQWSGRRPECKRRCNNPLIPFNGPTANPPLTRGQSTIHGTTITFSCRPKFTLEGQRNIRCDNGRWSGNVPVCKAPCTNPGGIPNGQKTGSDYSHGKFVTYECLGSTYSLDGDSRLTCTNGRWDRSKPSCKRGCSRPRNPDYGGIYRNIWKNLYSNGNRVRFYCDRDYILDGDEYTTCVNGVWNNDPPTCKRRCGYPGRFSNGRFSGTEYFEGKEIRYYCFSGYDLIGAQRARCLSTGQWSGRRPECKRRCSNPRIPSNGPTANPPLTSWQRTKHGTTVTFSCRPRYTLEGQKNIRCENGQWIGRVPLCKAPCSNPEDISFGFKTGSNYTHGNQVTYSCLGLYILDGFSPITCNNGQWDRSKPSCKGPCQDPGSPIKGIKIGLDYRHGKTVSYTCQEGTRLVGTSSSTCNDGRWSSAVPACMDNCKKPDKPLNGSMVGNDFSHGQRVSFQCHNGFRLRGNRTMVCYNGRWNSTIPTCIGVCPPLGVPINGERLDSNFDYNARVRFECNSGYDIRGPTALFCVNGKWNNKTPVCKARCPNPGFPRNGRRKGNDFGHHMSVEFFCNNGYDLIGRQSIRCEDGRWSGSPPACEVGCQDPGIPEGMKRQGDSFKSRSSLIYSCIAPLAISGNSVLTCNNGRWSHNLPSCSDCGTALGMKNNKIPDGNIRASSERDWNHQAKDGRLNGPRAWCSGREQNPYIEIDFGKPYQLTSLATQGSALDIRWVGSFAMKINLAGSRFDLYREHNTDKVFQGNTNASSVVKNRFTKRIIARRIRLHPLKVGGFLRQPACMRVEIYGCDLPLDCVIIKSRVVAKWNSNYYGGFVYYKAYLTAITNRVWKVELENERHGNPKYKNIPKYEDLPFVLDVPPKHEELQVGTKVLAPWGSRYYTGTIVSARDSNNRYQVRADDNDRDMFTIDQIRLLKAPTFCN